MVYMHIVIITNGLKAKLIEEKKGIMHGFKLWERRKDDNDDVRATIE